MRLASKFLIGLLVGFILHVLIVLAIPSLATSTSWVQLASRYPAYQTIVLEAKALSHVNQHLPPDPHMLTAMCHFDLGAQPVRFRGTLPENHWLVGVFNAVGTNVFNFSDLRDEASTVAVGGRLPLDILILKQEYLDRLDLEKDAWIAEAVIIQTPVSQGFLLLRAFVPAPIYEPVIRKTLSAYTCTPVELLDAPLKEKE